MGGLDATHRTQEGEDHLDAADPVEMVADSLRRLADVGFAHPVLVFRTPFDLETIERPAGSPGGDGVTLTPT